MVNNNLRNRFALLLLTLVAPLAGVSAAGLLDLNNNDYSNTAATVETHVDNPVNTVKSTVNSTVNGTVKTNTNLTASSSANINAHINASPNSAINADTQVTGDSAFTMDRSSEEVTGTLGSQISAENVATSADLKAFAATQLKNDENLSSVSFGPDNLEVVYKERARFLGIIPTSVNVGVVANNDGTVEFSYPWYSFLMVSNKADLEASIKTEAADFQANGSAIVSARDKAILAARIQAVLRAHLVGESGNATSTQGAY